MKNGSGSSCLSVQRTVKSTSHLFSSKGVFTKSDHGEERQKLIDFDESYGLHREDSEARALVYTISGTIGHLKLGYFSQLLKP